MKKHIMNEKIAIRLLSLLTIGIILFIISWILGYYFMPEGLFQGKVVSSKVVGAEKSTTFLAEWGKIAGYNLGVIILMVMLNLILWLDLFPLGYMMVFGNVALYGLFIGTNSFTIPMPERMAPSFVIFTRSGPYEMLGFILVAAATYNQSRFALTNESHRITSVPKISFEQWLGFGFGVLFILLAAWHEASMIMAV